jgi:Flp pilus assembly protein TadG
MKRTTSQRGNALIEFGLVSAVMLPLFFGTFQFGYTFYVYNLLQTQVRGGVRYASFRTFRPQDASSVATFKTAVRNMVRFSTPDGSGTLIVPNLDDGDIEVKVLDKDGADANSANAPATVSITVSNYLVDAVFTSFTFNQRPFLEFPYFGRYAPTESEP